MAPILCRQEGSGIGNDGPYFEKRHLSSPPHVSRLLAQRDRYVDDQRRISITSAGALGTFQSNHMRLLEATWAGPLRSGSQITEMTAIRRTRCRSMNSSSLRDMTYSSFNCGGCDKDWDSIRVKQATSNLGTRTLRVSEIRRTQ